MAIVSPGLRARSLASWPNWLGQGVRAQKPLGTLASLPDFGFALMLLLYWLVTGALYLALVRWLAHKVPAQQYPLLGQLHGVTSALSLLGVAVPLLTLGDWMVRLPLFACLLLASGVLAGMLTRLELARRRALLTTQAVLVGLVAPLLLANGLASRSASTAYADSSCTITVTEHAFSWMDEKVRVSEVEFYSTRLLLFEKYLGHVRVQGLYDQGKATQVQAWWQGVSSLTFEADSSRGVLWRNGAATPFSVEPPAH